MAQKWTLAELTELDLRLQSDMASDVTFSPENASQNLSKSEVLHRWMRESRNIESEATRLAAVALHSINLLGLSLAIFSLLIGISAAAGLLRYGSLPLMNISSYLGVLVGLQLLFILIGGLSAVLFRKQISGLQKWLLPPVIKNISAPLSIRAWGWRLFTLLQISGITFNLGVLLITFGKGLTNDLAFGWASTLDIGAARIQQIVDGLATLWGGTFTPSLEAIEHSRILLSTTVDVYDRSATAAWWPFLMMCVVFYGLLPRLCLGIWGGYQSARSLKHPPLDHPDCERLFLALTRKPISFTGLEPSAPNSSKKSLSLCTFKPNTPLRLELPKEVAAQVSETALAQKIQKHYEINLDPQASGLLKVMELWQPPLEETLRELRICREQLGDQADIFILGLGFPAPDSDKLFLPPDAMDLTVWQKRLAELNDPHLGLIPWRNA